MLFDHYFNKPRRKIRSTPSAIGAFNLDRCNLPECVPFTGDDSMATKSKKSTTKAKPGENKSAKVIAMLKRPSGVTREEVLKVTGWKAVSMQQVATNAGVKLKIDDSNGRPFRYRAA